MNKAPIKENEAERQEALNIFNIVDTPPELNLDEITELAAYICNTPISLISLIDKDRQWFKSKVGLKVDETSRDISFCGHTIYEDEVFIIENSLEDERFKDNPLVTNDPHVIFYAGAPLTTKSGHKIGTLCVIDNKPRKLNEKQVNALKTLSKQIMTYFEFKKMNENSSFYLNRYSIIMNNMCDGVVLQEQGAKIIDFNPAALRILGLTENQILGKTSFDPGWQAIKEDETEFPGTEHPAVVCLSTGKTVKDKLMGVRTPDEKLRWINITATPIFEDQTKTLPSHTVSTFTDITEKRVYENRLKLCLNSIDIGLWEWDIAHNILIWDASSYKLYEMKESDHSGAYEAWLNSLHPEDKIKANEYVTKCISEGKGLDFNFRIITPSNKIKYIHAKADLKLDSHNKAQKYYGVNIDITKETESKLSLEKLQFALNNSAIISFTDIKGDIIKINENFCKISGYSENELLGKNHRILNSKFHSKEFFNTLWHTISSGNIWHGEICNMKKNGELYWVDSSIIPFKNSFNIIEQYVSIRYDITPRKTAEQQLLYSSKMTSLGEMAGGIAHEINNPLAIISGRSDQLLRSIEKENIENKESFKTKLLEIASTSKRIIKIIKGLRQFSRNSENDPMLKVNLSNIIEDTVSLCVQRFKNNSIDIKISGKSELYINCRATEISQVLLNLLNNSYDAIVNLNEKWVEINTEINHDEHILKISVIDSGHGILNEILPKIMQPFFTTKDVGKGTGLGLSISKGLIEGHNGTLYYDQSALNTTFVIKLLLN